MISGNRTTIYLILTYGYFYSGIICPRI